MYLKKIVAQGFKSFADNTVIDLDPNIVEIVGPNGSGKSNVVDAIRWVLGEQSVKSLRGDGNMTDVIFAGSKSRKPMGIASVSLIFDNSDSYLPLDYQEIEIKRRLYKDGTNEFFLNNEKVRLKDINDLLMDSGIGKESFNIISQGKIEEILLSKPVDRRTIFEEASGVLKYKKRKEEAIRKLERTHDNMDRVKDIVNELEQQVGPLKEQKEKALEYIEYSEELKGIDIALSTHDIKELNDKYQKEKDLKEKLTLELTSIETSNTRYEASISALKETVENSNKNINELQKRLLESTTKVEKLKSQKEILLERKKFEVEEPKLHSRILELKEQELDINNKLGVIEYELKSLDENNRIKEIELKGIEEKVDELKDTRAKAEEKLTNQIRNQKIIESKIRVLEESIDNGSTLPFAVKSVLNHPKLRGIHNTIGRVIDTKEIYIKAINIALGFAANNIIVDNEKCASEAIQYLKNNQVGRATFFPLNIIEGKELDHKVQEELKHEEGFISIASYLVTYNPIYDKIIQNQLGNILVVDTLEHANKISKKYNYRYRIVTMDGELLHVGGSLTGGETKNKNPMSDKYELEKYMKEKEVINNVIETIENNINVLDNNIQALSDELYLSQKEYLVSFENEKEKQRRITELKEQLEEVRNNITSTDSMLNHSLSEEEDKALENLYKAREEQEKIKIELDEEQNKLASLNNDLALLEHNSKKENSLYLEKTKAIQELDIDINRIDVKLDNLLNTLSETYSMTYEFAKENYPLELEYDAAKMRINSLKRLIRDLGPINQQAPEEYDKVSARYEFLIKQQDDLVQAENTLLDIINQLDQVMIENFKKTFRVINENFDQTFKELFKGGKASLELTDPDNLLETGIEIIASPPGKSLKSISLLSGGEKTFTAISLLFAILKTRPMPFCILDEVEAALDEVNVESFGDYLSKLKKKTQFIVITHKKKTMEYADTLYGITMQESGVSKLVSVKLEDVEK